MNNPQSNIIDDLRSINDRIVGKFSGENIDPRITSNIDSAIDGIRKAILAEQASAMRQNQKRAASEMSRQHVINLKEQIFSILNNAIPIDDVGAYDVNDPYDPSSMITLSDEQKIYMCNELFGKLRDLMSEMSSTPNPPNMLEELKMAIFTWGVTKYVNILSVIQMAGDKIKQISGLMTALGLSYNYLPDSMKSSLATIPYIGSIFGMLNSLQPVVGVAQTITAVTVVFRAAGLNPMDMIIPYLLPSIQSAGEQIYKSICNMSNLFNPFSGMEIIVDLTPTPADVIPSYGFAVGYNRVYSPSPSPSSVSNSLQNIINDMDNLTDRLRQNFSQTISQANYISGTIQSHYQSSQYSQSYQSYDDDESNGENKRQRIDSIGGRRLYRLTRRRRNNRRNRRSRRYKR